MISAPAESNRVAKVLRKSGNIKLSISARLHALLMVFRIHTYPFFVFGFTNTRSFSVLVSWSFINSWNTVSFMGMYLFFAVLVFVMYSCLFWKLTLYYFSSKSSFLRRPVFRKIRIMDLRYCRITANNNFLSSS